MSSVSLAAEKQRRYRQRQRHPSRSVLRCEVEQGRLVDALVRSGRLAERDCWRRDLIEEALSLTIAAWIDEVL
jgi:hypothetical protein